MDAKLEKVYAYVEAQENKYYDFAFKAMDKNNMFANRIHSAEASVFQRVRYFIEMLEEDNHQDTEQKESDKND